MLGQLIREIQRQAHEHDYSLVLTGFLNRVPDRQDLQPDMVLEGVVTNITNFGAFVDVGVHQDGLVHISELSDKFVKNPADVVKVQQKVDVSVLSVDLERNRISLSMKKIPGKSASKSTSRPKPKNPKSHKGNTRHKTSPFNNPFADLLGSS